MASIELKSSGKLQSTLDNMLKKLRKGKTLDVGFMSGATYPNGTPVAMVAAIQNYGAPKASIPPRPFFTNMVKEKSPEWGESLAAVLKENDYDSIKALKAMGMGIEGQLRQSIIDTDSPALSPITVMLRGMRSHDQTLVVTGKVVAEAAARVKAGETDYGASTKPLDDTAHMLNSVQSAVDGDIQE